MTCCRRPPLRPAGRAARQPERRQDHPLQRPHWPAPEGRQLPRGHGREEGRRGDTSVTPPRRRTGGPAGDLQPGGPFPGRDGRRRPAARSRERLPSRAPTPSWPSWTPATWTAISTSCPSFWSWDLPVVVALNMGDVAAARGLSVDADVAWRDRAGLPRSSRSRLTGARGLDALREALRGDAPRGPAAPPPPRCRWNHRPRRSRPASQTLTSEQLVPELTRVRPGVWSTFETRPHPHRRGRLRRAVGPPSALGDGRPRTAWHVPASRRSPPTSRCRSSRRRARYRWIRERITAQCRDPRRTSGDRHRSPGPAS